MFEGTRKIVEETEAYLLNLNVRNQHLSLVARIMWFPLNYLLLGLKEFFKPAAIWWFLSFVFLLTSSLILGYLEIPPEYTLFVFNLCIYLPLAMVIFAVPSTYAYYGVENSHVKHVAKIIDDAGFNTADKVELLEQNIENILSRINTRITFYKWLVGSIWAIYLFKLNAEIGFIIKADEKELVNAIANNVESFVLMLASTLGALILVVGYKRASELLMKTIEFAAVEQKGNCLTKSSTMLVSRSDAIRRAG